MNKNEQISAIKNALTQFELISDIEQELTILKTNHFRNKPLPPTLEQIPDPEYPAIKTDTKFLSWKLLPGLLFWPWIIIYFFKFYMKEEEVALEKIRNSPEYRAQCEKLDQETRQKRQAAEEKYEAELKEYNEIILPKYQKEYEEWVKNHSVSVSEVEERLLDVKNRLQDILLTLDEIPAEYKEAPILSYILHLISNANKTTIEAVNIYSCRHIFTECPRELNASMRWYSKGDESINRYIDAIVGNLKAKLPEIHDIYGGTNQSKRYRLDDKDALSKPNIVVKYDMEFNAYSLEKGAYYTNITAYGQFIEHPCSTSKWVVNLNPYLMVFTATKEENDAIIEVIKNTYANEVVIEINDLTNNDEKCPIALRYKSKSETKYFESSANYKTCIFFDPLYVVYNVKNYEMARMGSDKILQSSLCIQAIHLKNLLDRSKKHAEDIDFEFAKLIDGNEVSTSLLSFESQRFRELKRCYNENKPLDKAKFYENFRDILTYYPDLWDRTIQGFSAEQIKADIQNQREGYRNRLNQVFEALNIPENIHESAHGLSYLAEGLTNGYYTTEEIVQSANEKIQADIQRELEREAEMEEFWAEMKERSNEMFDSAKNAIGNKRANKKKNQFFSGRKNLFGSHLCRYGQKDINGWTIHCGLQCPVADQCTQRGRFEEG